MNQFQKTMFDEKYNEQTRMSPHGAISGLECLKNLDTIHIVQKVELLEAIVGIEGKNKYLIKDESNQTLFFATEESNWCARNCFGALREFDITLHDPQGHEIIHLLRPLQCEPELSVTVVPDNLIGKCKQAFSWGLPKMSVMDEHGQRILTVKRVWACNCSGEVTFKIKNLNGEVVGNITKNWSGLAREFFTDADNFTITFPVEFDVKTKAVLIGACLLVVSFSETDLNQD